MVQNIILNFILSKFRRTYKKIKFAKEGRNLHYASDVIFNSPSMMEFGDNCSIGPHCIFYSIYKKIVLKNNVMLGPGVTIITGDHHIRKVGIPICKNKEKFWGDDVDVIVEDDVWIGANVTILKGVTVGRGAVIGAGAVVVKSIPSYTIAGGVPAKVIGIRFTIKQVLEHESILYSKENRLLRTQLQHLNKFIKENNC